VVSSYCRNGYRLPPISISYQANTKAKLFEDFRDAFEAERGQQSESLNRAGHMSVISSNPHHIVSSETTLLEKLRHIRDEWILSSLTSEQTMV